MGALPSRGTVEYGGRALRHVPLESRVAAGMTLVPERRELFGAMTVEDNLRLGGLHPPGARATWTACMPAFPACASAAPSTRVPSRAASSRCWPSAAP
ncbi:ABC-type transporter, ATPase component: HAAT family (plasmid) [Deinococcus gobiensis I-0]|uniref:ABC-type transporter, ATPase component: HAAT family n=1 Tax=Deinococcus gobiensis (strain DSM 21396 / JCM 16679 / CGMCC 1.7299 / I-0) TaxID=745776 RepID=H8H160_DEIGI|nr:ABC-type transporter, ATPase component: HAAT family [Deinococcus gobiensis I-0]